MLTDEMVKMEEKHAINHCNYQFCIQKSRDIATITPTPYCTDRIYGGCKAKGAPDEKLTKNKEIDEKITGTKPTNNKEYCDA